MLKKTICQARKLKPANVELPLLSRIDRSISYIPRHILLLVIFIYRRIISPLTPARCRFYPSCSEYSYTTLRNTQRPFYLNLWLVVKRIVKCHPGHPGGIDLPVETNDNHAACFDADLPQKN